MGPSLMIAFLCLGAMVTIPAEIRLNMPFGIR